MSWRDSQHLMEIINDQLTIGSSPDDLQIEIDSNTWLISMNSFERKNVSVDDLLEFFEAVINNRRQQLQTSSISHGMHFYVWHDRQASQLRFSLISDFHDALPFRAKTVPCNLSNIIREFLSSNDGLSYDLLEIADATQENLWEDVPVENVLQVYQVHLRT